MVNKPAKFPARSRPFVGLRQRLAGLCIFIALSAAGAGFAAVTTESKPADAEGQPVSYAEVSDEQLTALAARWDSLATAERRALLSEVKMRMARRQGSANRGSANGVLRIRLTRRYGAVPQGRAAGRLHIRLGTGPANAKEFGVGFEQRAGQPQAADQAPAEQAVKAATQQAADPG